MNAITQWKNSAVQLAESHERVLTYLLVTIALILLAIAIYGKAHHKALALVYIAL